MCNLRYLWKSYHVNIPQAFWKFHLGVDGIAFVSVKLNEDHEGLYKDGVILATLCFWDITRFKTVVSVCLQIAIQGCRYGCCCFQNGCGKILIVSSTIAVNGGDLGEQRFYSWILSLPMLRLLSFAPTLISRQLHRNLTDLMWSRLLLLHCLFF